jgi:hypothetical protein
MTIEQQKSFQVLRRSVGARLPREERPFAAAGETFYVEAARMDGRSRDAWSIRSNGDVVPHGSELEIAAGSVARVFRP